MQVSTRSPVSVGLLFGPARDPATPSDLAMAQGRPVAGYHLETAWLSARASTRDRFGAPLDRTRSTIDLSN